MNSAPVAAPGLARCLLAAALLALASPSPSPPRPARGSNPSPLRLDTSTRRRAVILTSTPPLHSQTLASPEAAQNVIFNAPQGVFGNPNAIPQCTASDFALDRVPAPTPRPGLITVHANYENNPDFLLGTAPIFDLEPGPNRRRSSLSSSRLWTSRSQIPVAVRTATDYGLRFTVSDITQMTPLARANLTFWGFPAEAKPRLPSASRRAPRGIRPAAPDSTDTSCIEANPRSASSRSPAHRQPDHLHRASR